MLRRLVLLLMLGNAGYFAWTQGLLKDYGYAPAIQAEPQRLAQQIRPDAMRLLTPAEILQLEPVLSQASATAPPVLPVAECLQAGLYTDDQASLVRARLEKSLPTGSWTLKNSSEPGRWIVYMGKYATEEALAKKRTQLRGLGLSFEPLVNPLLGPGLSLGHFNTQAEAERELARVTQHGVRTARVLQERPELHGQLLRLPEVDAALKARIDALSLQLEGKTLQPCL